MLNDQSMPPDPEPVESCSVVANAASRSASVEPGMVPPLDHSADATDTPTVCMSLRSTSLKLSVPVGTGVVESSEDDPLTPVCSATEPDSGPLVIATASLAPVMTTETVWLALVELSLTSTL